MSEPRKYADGDGGEVWEYRITEDGTVRDKERPLQVGDRVKVVRVLGTTPADGWAQGFVGREGVVERVAAPGLNPIEVAIGHDRPKFTFSEVEYIPEESLDEKLGRIDPQPHARLKESIERLEHATTSGICEDDWKGLQFQGTSANGEPQTIYVAGYEDDDPEWQCQECGSKDTWFDRSFCPEPCGTMHTRCAGCGKPEGGCALDSLTPTPRRRALMEAADIVDNERNHEYGEPKDNLGRTAALVQVLFPERQWTPADIALFMVMVKAARLVHTRGHDTGIDMLGWGALYLELEES